MGPEMEEWTVHAILLWADIAFLLSRSVGVVERAALELQNEHAATVTGIDSPGGHLGVVMPADLATLIRPRATSRSGP